MGAAERAAIPEAGAGEAVSHAIGWCDFATLPAIQPPCRPVPPAAADERPEPPWPRPPVDELALRLAAVLQVPLGRLLEANAALEWPAPLFGYQRQGVAALLNHRELLLADDMGLGKTIQAIAALRLLYFRQPLEAALVVCPASLLAQWGREFARWAPELRVAAVTGDALRRAGCWRVPAHVKLVSYETLRADVLDLRDSPALRRRWDVVVLDEAARIKNRESGVSLACKRLPRERRWALTGTPLENRLDDVISILEFLLGEPGSRGFHGSSASQVRAELRRLQLRRKKEDVLPDLPPKQVNEVVLQLPPGQRASYDRLERAGTARLREAGETATVVHVLELITRLKQVCNRDPASGESAKLADLAERLRTLVAEGHRALVFSQFTDERFGVAGAAEQLAEFQPLEYTGGMAAGRRAAVVDRFLAQPRHKALLLSLRAGGVGLNLQAASYVFHLDRWWNPATEEQAEGRAHRLGQPYPVTVFRYLCADTIEERIDRKLREKRRLFQEIVDDVSLDLTTALSEEELFGLFGLPAPAAGGVDRRGA